MIAPSTGGSCYLSVTPSPTYSAICYIWECLAAESSFGQTVGHAYPSLTYGRFQRGGLTFQWQLGRCLQIADLHRECRLIPSLDLSMPVRRPPALVIRQRICTRLKRLLWPKAAIELARRDRRQCPKASRRRPRNGRMNEGQVLRSHF